MTLLPIRYGVVNNLMYVRVLPITSTSILSLLSINSFRL